MAAEKVGIEIELMGGEEALALLQRIDGTIDTLNKRKKFKTLSGLNSAKGELEGYIRTLDKYEKELGDLERKANEAKKAMARWGKPFENSAASTFAKRNIKAYEDAKREIAEAEAGIRRMGVEMDEVTVKTRTFKQEMNSISSAVAHVGSAMQSLGNAMVRLTSPFRRITSGLLMGAGYKALNLFTEGLSNTFQRSDTMRNYSRSLKALGLDVEQTFSIAGKEAKTAKDNLDDAVQGLPTSLDEIMAAQKIYAGATGEMVESTKTAIAANNAVIASGMGAREQRFMQKYLVALASGAELTTTQWDSMGRIAPLVMRSVAKELNYADDAYQQFNSDVRDGTISTQEFLKAFQEVGISGKVAQAALVATESWSGLSSNIRIAVTRMGQGIIDTLGETFKKETGRTLLQTLLGIDAEGNKMGDGIRDWINGISESVQNWIQAHPEEIIGFFNDLKSIDWKGLAKGFGEGALEFARLIGAFAKWASGKDLSKLGKWMPRLNILGNGLLVLGGFLKGTRHIWGILGALVKKGGKLGLFGKLASLFGKKKAIEEVGEIGKAVTIASPKLVSAFKNMALISGIVAAPAVTAWGVTEATRRSISNFKETINLLKDIDWADAKKLLLGIGGFLGGSAILGGIIGNVPGAIGAGVGVAIGETVVGVIMSIASGFADLNMAFIKDSIEKFVESVKLLDEIPDVSSFGDVKTKLSNAISVMNEITSLINGEWIGPGMHEGGVESVGLGTVWNINSIANALTPLKTAAERISELATITIPTNAVSNIQAIIDAVSEIASGMWQLLGFGFGNISSNITKIADGIFELRRAVYHINKIGGEKVKTSGIKSLKNAIKQIKNAFDVNAIGSLRATITAFVASIEDAFAELSKLNQTIEINASVKLSPNFSKSVQTVITTIKNGKDSIKALRTPVAFSIPVTVTFSVSSNLSSALAQISRQRQTLIDASNGNITNYGSPIGPPKPDSGTTPAMGGLIYRAHGGSVFKRKGTDTVPAMLTPGEYVHNKRAVNTFGIDFMRKVNNLDIKGAMNELMHRAGGMANINRGSVVNNTYNNQKVVINNNGNPGAGYTFKGASRFVGAF